MVIENISSVPSMKSKSRDILPSLEPVAPEFGSNTVYKAELTVEMDVTDNSPGPSAPSGDFVSYALLATAGYMPSTSLQAYNNRLFEETLRENIFKDDPKSHVIWVWDLPVNATASSNKPLKLSTLEELKDVIGVTPPNPKCRFIFLQTARTRGRLCCSREQLVHILASHSVMPSFLDFCFEFKRRESPTVTNMFRVGDVGQPQDHLGCQKRLQQRCNFRIQHAFSIMAFERGNDNYEWPLRRVVAYHSLDLAEGRTLWLLIKGNKLMRERITECDDVSPLVDSAEGSLNAAMRTHLVILSWCAENWTEYIDELEDRARQPTTAVTSAPIEDMTTSGAIQLPPSRHHAGPRRGTGFSRHSATNIATHSGPVRRALSNLSRLAAGPQDDGEEEEDVQFGDIFSYNCLQSAHRVSEDIDRARLVLEQNMAIVKTLLKRFEELREVDELKEFLATPTVRPSLTAFLQQLRSLDNDLGGYYSRLETLYRGLRKTEEKFKNIIDYGNMRASQKWTESMHELAVQTENETLSMHVITIFTLVFLPGTFFSTLLSSGMFVFPPGGSGLRDFTISRPAVLLFLCMAIPMTLVTVSIWGFIYLRSLRRQRKGVKTLNTASLSSEHETAGTKA